MTDNTSAHDILTSNIIIRRKSIIPSSIMIQTPHLLQICADPAVCKDPVISFLPADGSVDMDAMRDSYLAVPAIGDCRAVVAMVGLEAAQREEAPREHGDDCVEWDNEFENIDGMPVYYGGDLCDSDDSEWDDPWDLAY